MEKDGDRYDNRKCFERLKKLTLLGSNSFHYLNVSNQWNTHSNYQNSTTKGKGPCDNCGGKHYAPDLLHHCDEVKIKKAKEERAARRGGGGCGGGRSGGRGCGCQGGCNKWTNDNKDGDKNDYGSGVQKRGNDWMLYCRRQYCGWNTTHNFGVNAAWKHDTGTFVLPYDHDYCKLSRKTADVATSTGASVVGRVRILNQLCSAISEVIYRYQGEASDAIFSSFLTDLYKVLDNLK